MKNQCYRASTAHPIYRTLRQEYDSSRLCQNKRKKTDKLASNDNIHEEFGERLLEEDIKDEPHGEEANSDDFLRLFCGGEGAA